MHSSCGLQKRIILDRCLRRNLQQKHAIDWYFDLTRKHPTPLSRTIQLKPDIPLLAHRGRLSLRVTFPEAAVKTAEDVADTGEWSAKKDGNTTEKHDFLWRSSTDGNINDAEDQVYTYCRYLDVFDPRDG